MEFGPVGVWFGPWFSQAPPAQVAEIAGALEEAGAGALWMSGGFGSGVDRGFRILLDATKRVTVASGIVSIWHAQAADVAVAVADLEAAHPRRFLLGLGVSHAAVVDQSGATYARPYSRMVAYLDELDGQQPPVLPQRRVLAALQPRMLELAGSRAAGAHPYFVPVEHTARARHVLGSGPLLAPELAVVLEADPARAREIAREYMSVYLTTQNYPNNLRTLGYDDDDLTGGGSDRLVDAVVAWGDVEAIVRRVREHHDAGADHVCIQVITGTERTTFPLEQHRILLDALRSART